MTTPTPTPLRLTRRPASQVCFIYSFPKRINLKELIEIGVIPDHLSAPQGFRKLSKKQFSSILKATKSHESIIIN